MYIISAGGKKPNWVPQQPKPMTKEASTKTAQVEEEEHDPLFEAVKGLDMFKKKDAPPAGAAPVDAAPADAAPAAPAAPVAESAPVAPEAPVAPAAPTGEPNVDAAKAKLEDIQQDVQEVMVALDGGEITDVAPTDDAAPVDEVEITLDEPVEEVGQEGGEEPKSEPESEVPGVKDEQGGEVEKEGCKASKEPTFLKLAHLSPENKKIVADYWGNVLGYPKEYVDAMVKDYEG